MATTQNRDTGATERDIVMELPCRLQPEVVELAKVKVCNLTKEIEAIEEQARTVASGFRGSIKKLKKERREANEEQRTGTRKQQVACKEVLAMTGRLVFRLDDPANPVEVVEERRALSPEEHQRMISEVAPGTGFDDSKPPPVEARGGKGGKAAKKTPAGAKRTKRNVPAPASSSPQH